MSTLCWIFAMLAIAATAIFATFAPRTHAADTCVLFTIMFFCAGAVCKAIENAARPRYGRQYGRPRSDDED